MQKGRKIRKKKQMKKVSLLLNFENDIREKKNNNGN